MPQDLVAFQKSITQELNVIKDRVENLIGNANWGEVGIYREAVLRKVISQFLPYNLTIGTGFIVADGYVSTQLDIIVYEDKSPVIFREGDFVILTESSVRAVIEVKSKIINYSDSATCGNDNALNKIIAKLNKLIHFPTFSSLGEHRKKFVGIFSFEYDGDFSVNRIDEALKISNGLVNHLSLGTNRFIRYWDKNPDPTREPRYDGRCYIRYNLEDLSFSYFISNLLHIVADEDPVERHWFSFPVKDTKEVYRAYPNPIIDLPNE